MSDFLPRRDAELVTWGHCFGEHIAADPQRYGLTEAQAAEFAQVQETFARMHQLANDPSTRTPSSIISKNAARRSMKAVARRLARVVQATPGVRDELKAVLGLAVASGARRWSGVPERAPRLTTQTTMSRKIYLRLRDPDSLRVGKPRGVIGAMIFSQVAEQPSKRASDWMFVCNTTRTVCEVNLPAGLKPGARVWFTAAWVDSRLRTGRWSVPAQALVTYTSTVPGDGLLPVAA